MAREYELKEPSGNAQPYTSLNGNSYNTRQYSRWNPRSWGKKTWAGVIAAVIVVIIVIIVGAVEGEKKNRYPDYSRLTYSLTDTYSGENFFDNFDFFTGYDPSGGFVHYSPYQSYPEMNLTYTSATSAVLRVDSTETNASTGRHSSRITSKSTYTTNTLFLFNILHTPYGCGTWPSVWLSDPSNWPNNGEIDVIEAVNNASTGNQMTLHTSNGCSMSGVKREMTGDALTTNCWNGTDANAGCGVRGPSDTYGAAANSAGGGIYAMELRTAGIRMWFFARDSLPADISNSSTSPDPSTWGEALADFPGTDCNIDNHFKNQSIIADINVCGDWAGSQSVYSKADQCPGSSCSAWVAVNPQAMLEAYWEFGWFKVFTAA